MSKWIVEITPKAKNDLLELLKCKKVTNADVKVLLRWVDEMEEFGPEYISRSSEWYDHELKRDWKGFRSSAFSYSGRVIYKVFDCRVIVEVHRVTTSHDYKK